ncbi:hypothetical protein K402DRAFT_33831 [Aulographum hederae CBS 113979]|uniref:Uncharacterized protein n=1 Tax=Aulographum hederae CBS 113979 TaxID=1176131 RepID=A0A6G1H568_9PEZI|nr:hypothetical protein K402DRAFT_33831 [Aulographum hederae CBS 113979]
MERLLSGKAATNRSYIFRIDPSKSPFENNQTRRRPPKRTPAALTILPRKPPCLVQPFIPTSHPSSQLSEQVILHCYRRHYIPYGAYSTLRMRGTPHAVPLKRPGYLLQNAKTRGEATPCPANAPATGIPSGISLKGLLCASNPLN